MRTNIQRRHSRPQKTAHERPLRQLEPTVHLGPAHVVVPRQKPRSEGQRNRKRYPRKKSPYTQSDGKVFFPSGHRKELLPFELHVYFHRNVDHAGPFIPWVPQRLRSNDHRRHAIPSINQVSRVVEADTPEVGTRTKR